MNKSIVVAITPLIIAFGFWLGEGGEPPWVFTHITSAIVSTAVVGVMIPGRLWIKSVSGVVFLVIYFGALYSGWYSFNLAFNECVEKGEEVRVQLNQFYAQHNQYPERLNQLPGLALCVRTIRPTILEYEKTSHGYALSFKDRFVEYTATETDSFMAHK